MKSHLAIFTPATVKQLFSGKKTIEIRLSQRKIPPFNEVSVGDLVYIKPLKGDVEGRFLVKKVISFESPTEEDLEFLNKKYTKKSLQNLNLKTNQRFITVIFLDQVEQFITSPVKIEKKDLRGWMVLDHP